MYLMFLRIVYFTVPNPKNPIIKLHPIVKMVTRSQNLAQKSTTMQDHVEIESKLNMETKEAEEETKESVEEMNDAIEETKELVEETMKIETEEKETLGESVEIITTQKIKPKKRIFDIQQEEILYKWTTENLLRNLNTAKNLIKISDRKVGDKYTNNSQLKEWIINVEKFLSGINSDLDDILLLNDQIKLAELYNKKREIMDNFISEIGNILFN